MLVNKIIVVMFDLSHTVSLARLTELTCLRVVFQLKTTETCSNFSFPVRLGIRFEF